MGIITHIPIAKAHTRREIFVRLALPFNIRENRNTKERKTWGIKATTDYVVTDKDHSSAYSMNKGDLETCLAIREAYYCQQPVRIINSLDGTCEAFIFKK